MKSLCLEPADIIAISAIFIAVATTIIQYIYESRREWHSACELLFESMDSLFKEIKELILNPNQANHTAYQQYLTQRKNLLIHYRKRFFLHKKCINKALKIVVFDLMDIPEKVVYEELMNNGFKKKEKQNYFSFSFFNDVCYYIDKASEALLS